MFTATVRRLIPLLAALAALLVVQAPASAAPLKSIWGPLTLPDGQSAGPTYKTLGVDDVQTAVTWNTIAPKRPARRYTVPNAACSSAMSSPAAAASSRTRAAS